MSFLINVLGTIVKQVANRNKTNDAIKTADPVVFEEVQKKMEHVEPATNNQDDFIKDYLDKVREAQVENEANPEVETADKSVYDDLYSEIDRLKAQLENQKTNPVVNSGHAAPPQGNQPMQAWNSTGSTLEARSAPQMGAPKTNLRIPNKGVFSVLDYSENSIILDGQNSRFVLVESNGQKGWILENYLNFN